MKRASKKRLPYVVVFLLIFAAFIGYIVLPGHAYTNATVTKCNASSVNTFTFGCTTPAEPTLGIVVVMCGGGGAVTAPSISDTSNNQWGFVGGVGSTAVLPSSAGFATSPHIDILIWWADLKPSTPSTDSITVTLQAPVSGCYFEIYSSDTAAYLLQTVVSNADADRYQNPSTTITNHVLVTSPIFNPVATMVFMVGMTYDNSAGNPHSIALSGSFPLTTAESNANFGVSNYANPVNINAIIWSIGSGYFPVGQNPNYASATFSSGTNSIRPYAVYLAVFAVGGVGPPNCADCTTLDGGNLLSTSTQALTSNQTYFYLDSTTNGQLNFQNITTRLSSVSLTNGQTFAILELGLYEVGTQINSTTANRNPITSGNPLNLIAFKDFTLTNTGTAKTYSFNPMVTIWNNTQYAISVSVGHNGVNVYQTSTTGLTLNLDNSDGYAPTAINSYATTTPQIYLASEAYSQVFQGKINAINIISISYVRSTSVQGNQPDPTGLSNSIVPTAMMLIPMIMLIGIGMIARVEGPIFLPLSSLGLAIGMTLGTFGKQIPFPFTLVMWIAFGFSIFITQKEGAALEIA